MTAFTRCAWGVLAYNLAVILWGAFVRATGSGAGCGKHWPLCNGEVIPRAPAVATMVEFAHRATSGLALLAVVALLAWARKAFEAGHPARRAAAWSLVLMLLEAAVGAGLVLFGWTADDRSLARGWAMAVHLVNTFLLVGALALTAWWSWRPGGLALAGRRPLALGFAAGAVTVLLAGVTGAVAALGDTLFPAQSLAHGLAQDFSPEAHLLLRLRVAHPLASVTAAVTLSLVARLALRHRPEPAVRGPALAVLVLVGVQLVVGVANLALLAPVALQLVHLLLADLVWIAFVLLAAATLAPGEVRAEAGAGGLAAAALTP
jgi:cytochrome c oxidase assembly protein subunit 15